MYVQDEATAEKYRQNAKFVYTRSRTKNTTLERRKDDRGIEESERDSDDDDDDW